MKLGIQILRFRSSTGSRSVKLMGFSDGLPFPEEFSNFSASTAKDTLQEIRGAIKESIDFEIELEKGQVQIGSEYSFFSPYEGDQKAYEIDLPGLITFLESWGNFLSDPDAIQIIEQNVFDAYQKIQTHPDSYRMFSHGNYYRLDTDRYMVTCVIDPTKDEFLLSPKEFVSQLELPMDMFHIRT